MTNVSNAFFLDRQSHRSTESSPTRLDFRLQRHQRPEPEAARPVTSPNDPAPQQDAPAFDFLQL